MVLGFTVSRAKNRSGQDLGLLALELLGRDDTPIAQVRELGQLVRRAGLARGLLDITTEGRVLLLSLLRGPLMHAAAADDQVHQDTDQRDEQHEQEPHRLASAGQVLAAEDVDEDGDQDPEPDHEQEDLQDRPERAQQRIRVRTRSKRHDVSLTAKRPGHPRRARRGREYAHRGHSSPSGHYCTRTRGEFHPPDRVSSVRWDEVTGRHLRESWMPKPWAALSLPAGPAHGPG